MASPQVLDPAAEWEWRRLRVQIDFAEGFWLGFAFMTSPAASRILEQRTERILRQHARAFVLVDVDEPPAAERVLTELLNGAPDAGCAWVRCVQAPSEIWTTTVRNLFARLNERCDALRRRLSGGLVFALHPSAKPAVRDAAPDLWSVRSLVLDAISTVATPVEGSVTPTRASTEEADPGAVRWPATPVSSVSLRRKSSSATPLRPNGHATKLAP